MLTTKADVFNIFYGGTDFTYGVFNVKVEHNDIEVGE